MVIATCARSLLGTFGFRLVSGESLMNDGTAIVVFVLMLKAGFLLAFAKHSSPFLPEM